MKRQHISSGGLWAALLLLCFNLTAQNVREDIPRINQYYESLQGAKVELQYRVRVDGQTGARETMTGTSRWNAQQSYMMMQNMEKFQDQQYAMLVNHEMQTILIQNARTEIEPVSPAPLDSLLARCEEVQFLKTGKGLFAYRFLLPSSQYQYVEVVFDPRSYQIKQMNCLEGQPSEYDENDEPIYAVMEIEYRQFQVLQEKQLAAEYTWKKFLQREGETFQLREPFQHYQLLNYTR